MTDAQMSSFGVLPCLPFIFRKREGDQFPDDLIGSTILNFGALDDPDDYGSAELVIDYQPPEGPSKRVVFGIHDTSMWVKYQTAEPPPATPG